MPAFFMGFAGNPFFLFFIAVVSPVIVNFGLNRLRIISLTDSNIRGKFLPWVLKRECQRLFEGRH